MLCVKIGTKAVWHSENFLCGCVLVHKERVHSETKIMDKIELDLNIVPFAFFLLLFVLLRTRVASLGNLPRTAEFSCQPVSQIDTAYQHND